MDEINFRKKLHEDRYRLEQYQSTILIHFPSIDKISINLKFTYNEVTQWKKERSLSYKPKDKAFFKIECINPNCVYTDLELKDEIQKMVWSKESHATGTKICNGYQDYKRYLSRGNHCSTEMEYEIVVEYK